MSPWEIALGIGALVLAAIGLLAGGYWGLAKMVAAQFNAALDIRFDALERSRQEGRKVWEERFHKIERKQEITDADVRRLLIELPREYVRREDWVRSQTIIEAKLDALALRIENALLKEREPR